MKYDINDFYQDDIKIIKKFLNQRPNVLGCYCYGIGESFGKKIYKLILISDDIWSWQYKNYRKNEKNDYLNFLYTSGYNFVQYLGIKENNCIFDYTLMSGSELIENLLYWKYFTFAEIFQKPFITIKSSNIFDKNIVRNQKNALTTSMLMLQNDNSSFFDLMLNLYCISSYLTSEKITLVNENYQLLKDIYNKYDQFYIDKYGKAIIDNKKLEQEILYLPNKIKQFICKIKGKDSLVGINNYFEEKMINENDSIKQMRYLVNGFFRTVDYYSRSQKVKTLKKNNDNINF